MAPNARNVFWRSAAIIRMKLTQYLTSGTLAFLLAATGLHATQSTSLQMQLGNPSGATSSSTNHNHYLLQCAQYAFDYSDNLGEPNWVSWDLTLSDQGSATRTSSFYADSRLPTTFYHVTSSDYTNSGYDRGHMCPSADRTDTSAHNKILFYMSNIVPQAPDNNQGPWEKFETYCRSLTSSGYEVLLISGPSTFNGSYIPSGAAAIPGYTWKIAVVVPSGSGTAVSRINTGTRCIALKVPNSQGIRSNPWQNYITSAGALQTATGFSFFTALSSTVRNALLAKIDSGN